MARFNYDRLSSQDNSFLLFEEPGLYMHVSATQIFELGPLATSEGGVDYERIRASIGSVLHRIPRYRQKLAWVPVEHHPVWVDDHDFDLNYHVRHTALPKPGSDAQLKKLTARVMAQHLDRERPLWEIWVVEGLRGNRFAIISKIHHCMIDGMSGVDISMILQSPDPQQTEIPEAPAFYPRPLPSGIDLLSDAIRHRVAMPFRALRGLREFYEEAENLGDEIRMRARAIRGVFAAQMTSASETPINGQIGPHRAFDWWIVPLADVKALRRAFDCTVNDVVLTVVTGAFRRYFERRGIDPAALDFRVQAPVSVRSERERGKLGNRVSLWVVPLPLGEADSRRQLEAIHETTKELKESRQALGVEMMMSVMEGMPPRLLSLAARAAASGMSTIVTNVPGPQFPLYLLGARLCGLFPQVPLLQNVGLGIALISYDGMVNWGFNADPKLVPDLSDFVEGIRASFHEMARAEGVQLPALPTPAASRRRAPSGDRTRLSDGLHQRIH